MQSRYEKQPLRQRHAIQVANSVKLPLRKWGRRAVVSDPDGRRVELTGGGL
jgi:hypothetical protein